MRLSQVRTTLSVTFCRHPRRSEMVPTRSRDRLRVWAFHLSEYLADVSGNLHRDFQG